MTVTLPEDEARALLDDREGEEQDQLRKAAGLTIAAALADLEPEEPIPGQESLV